MENEPNQERAAWRLPCRLPSALLPVGIELLEGRSSVARSSAIALARWYGSAGIEISVFLKDLDEVYTAVEGAVASTDLVRACADAWSGAIVSSLEQWCCADPLTGLETIGHLTRTVENLARLQRELACGFTAVVIKVKFSRQDDLDLLPSRRISNKLQLAVIGEVVNASLDCLSTCELDSETVVAVVLDGPWIDVQINRALFELRNAGDGFDVAGIKKIPLPCDTDEAEWWVHQLKCIADDDISDRQ